MRILLTFILTLLTIMAFAQTEKGASPIPNTSIHSTQTTRAVVIGISNYQDDRIPDLNFAHIDAQAFAAYLQSPAGGALPQESIYLLTNEKATSGQMYAALDWLIEDSKTGDQAIIYFSGHGDVETVTRRQRGFLLTHDSPPNNYRAGAYALVFLQDVIETLSIDKETQVIMISDACRAGKLAGSSIGGTQATTSALAQQYANEIKILSCQPEEFSVEGEQWGGGRGCFSYHLLDGLYGLADKNTDGKVTLLEIDGYLEDKVMKETPHSQIPLTIGRKSAVIAHVNKEYLEQIIADKKNQQSILAGIESKGIEELILENVDTNIQELYQDFLVAIENGNLLEPEGKSANDYYGILIQEKSIEELHGFMRRNFAAALQDESQIAINNLLAVDRDYLVHKWFIKKKNQFPLYLNRAMELIGEDHYLYNDLKVRMHYFLGWNYLLSTDLKNNINQDSINQSESIKNFKKAIELDSTAVFVLEGLASAYRKKYHLNLDAAINSLERAVEMAPTWPLPYYDLGTIYRNKGNLEQAEFWYLESLKIDSTFFGTYSRLSALYRRSKKYEKAEDLLRKILAIDSTDYYSYFSLAALYIDKKEFGDAISTYEHMAPYLPNENAVIYKYHINLLDAYLAANLPEKAIQFSRKILESRRDSIVAFAGLGFANTYLSNFAAANKYFQMAASMSEDPFYQYLCFSGYNSMVGNTKKAILLLEKNLRSGNRDFYIIQTNKCFDPIRNHPEFIDIMKKYFPNRFNQ